MYLDLHIGDRLLVPYTAFDAQTLDLRRKFVEVCNSRPVVSLVVSARYTQVSMVWRWIAAEVSISKARP